MEEVRACSFQGEGGLEQFSSLQLQLAKEKVLWPTLDHQMAQDHFVYELELASLKILWVLLWEQSPKFMASQARSSQFRYLS